MPNSIQLIPIEGDALFLTGVLFRDGKSGFVRFNGRPIKLAREEHFDIEGTDVITEQFHFPFWFLQRFLEVNDFVVEGAVKIGEWMEASRLAPEPDLC